MAKIRASIKPSEAEIKAKHASTDKAFKRQELQAKMIALADKKKKGQLTLEDIDAKLDIILGMLIQPLE